MKSSADSTASEAVLSIESAEFTSEVPQAGQQTVASQPHYTDAEIARARAVVRKRRFGGSHPAPEGKLRLVTRQSLDQRTLASKQFDAIVRQIRRDCGDTNCDASGISGDSDLSTVQIAMIEAFAGVSVLLDAMTVKVLLGEKIDALEFCTLSSTLVRIGSRLGLTRKNRTGEVPNLRDYLDDKGEPGDTEGIPP
jgi:hypothetical protein